MKFFFYKVGHISDPLAPMESVNHIFLEGTREASNSTQLELNWDVGSSCTVFVACPFKITLNLYEILSFVKIYHVENVTALIIAQVGTVLCNSHG